MPNSKLTSKNRAQSKDRAESGKTITLGKENEQSRRDGDGEEEMDCTNAEAEADGDVTKNVDNTSSENSNKKNEENTHDSNENKKGGKVTGNKNRKADDNMSVHMKGSANNQSSKTNYNSRSVNKKNGFSANKRQDQTHVDTRADMKKNSEHMVQNEIPVKCGTKPSSKSKQTRKSFDNDEDYELDGYQYDYDEERFDMIHEDGESAGSEEVSQEKNITNVERIILKLSIQGSAMFMF